jgi:hypothetical protein
MSGLVGSAAKASGVCFVAVALSEPELTSTTPIEGDVVPITALVAARFTATGRNCVGRSGGLLFGTAPPAKIADSENRDS